MPALAEVDRPTASAEQAAEAERSAALPAWVFPTLLTVVMVGALVLRIWGLRMGLPSLLHPDEWRIVMRAMAMGTGDLDPHTADVGHLMIYLCFGLFAAYGGLGLITGHFASIEDIGIRFCNDPTVFYLLARGLSLVCGLVAIYLVYLIGRELANRWAGMAGAILLAANPIHVERSHLAYPDTLMIALMLGGLYAMARASSRKPEWRVDAFIGALIGLACAAKYLAAFASVAYVVWRILEARRTGSGGQQTAAALAHFGLGCAAAFAISSPYVIVHASDSVATIIGRSGLSQQNSLGLGAFMVPYEGLGRSMRAIVGPKGIGAIGSVLAILGLLTMAPKHLGYRVGLLLALLVNAAWLANHGRFMARWLFPGTLNALLLAAVGFGGASEWLSARFSSRIGTIVPLSLILLIALQPLKSSTQMIARLAGPHTQVIAAHWIEANIPAGTAIVIDGATANSAQVRANRKSLERMLADAEQVSNSDYAHVDVYYRFQLAALDRHDHRAYDIRKLKHTWWRHEEIDRSELRELRDKIPVAPGQEIGRSFEYYLREGVAYLVTTQGCIENYNNADFPRDRAFYRAVAEHCRLIWEVKPTPRVYGPHIMVFATPHAMGFETMCEDVSQLATRQKIWSGTK